MKLQNDAVKKAVVAVREVEKTALRQSKEESEAWAKAEKARIPTAKERQMKALRTLDALLSAFPPEIRGRVGGFVQLAALGTDKAREAEIERRITKLDEVVESEAKKHYGAEVAKLFERAKPKRKAGAKRDSAMSDSKNVGWTFLSDKPATGKNAHRTRKWKPDEALCAQLASRFNDRNKSRGLQTGSTY